MKAVNNWGKIWRAVLFVITCGTSALIRRTHSRYSRAATVLLATLIVFSLLLILPVIPLLTKMSLIFWHTRSDEAVNKASNHPSSHSATVQEKKLQSLAGRLPGLQRSDKQEIKQIAEQYLGLESASRKSRNNPATQLNVFSFHTAIPKSMHRSIIDKSSGTTPKEKLTYEYIIKWQDANGNTKYTTIASAKPDRQLERLMRLLQIINENQNLGNIYEIVAPMLLEKNRTSN